LAVGISCYVPGRCTVKIIHGVGVLSSFCRQQFTQNLVRDQI
jgi:hypothetical protein